jgi:hypothetical protein
MDAALPFFVEESGLFIRPKRQQHIAGHAAIPRITGIDEDDATSNYRASSVERASCCLDSIHGGIFLGGIDVPENFTVFGRKCPQMSVKRT